jgi:hypothetical protein
MHNALLTPWQIALSPSTTARHMVMVDAPTDCRAASQAAPPSGQDFAKDDLAKSGSRGFHLAK